MLQHPGYSQTHRLRIVWKNKEPKKKCSRKEKCVLKKDRTDMCSRWGLKRWCLSPTAFVHGQLKEQTCYEHKHFRARWVSIEVLLAFLQHSQHLKAKLETLGFLLKHPTWLSMALSKHYLGLIPPSRRARWQSPRETMNLASQHVSHMNF